MRGFALILAFLAVEAAFLWHVAAGPALAAAAPARRVEPSLATVAPGPGGAQLVPGISL